MAALAPWATVATTGTTDDDQCKCGCPRFSAGSGRRRGQPDRDSATREGRGSRMGSLRDVLSVGNLLPPFGMADDCRGDSWTSLFLSGSAPRESHNGCIPDWLGPQSNLRGLHGLAAIGSLRRHLRG